MTKSNKPEVGAKREREIGKRLKEVREFLSFSQSEFAAALGIQKARLASYESGRVPLRWEIALKLCHEYFVSEYWLATGGGRAMGTTGKPLRFGGYNTRNTMIPPGSAFLKSVPAGLPFSSANDMVLSREYWQRAGASGRTIMQLALIDEVHYSAKRLQMQTDWMLSYWRAAIPQHLWGAYCVPLMKFGALLFDTIYDLEDLLHKRGPKDEKRLAAIMEWLGSEMMKSGLVKSNAPGVPLVKKP